MAFKKPVPKVKPVEVKEETSVDAIARLQKEIEKLQEPSLPMLPPEEEEEVKEEPTEDPKKQVTVNDVLVNHEQRITEMESKWFRLGGI